jgi:hypothetical protein
MKSKKRGEIREKRVVSSKVCVGERFLCWKNLSNTIFKYLGVLLINFVCGSKMEKVFSPPHFLSFEILSFFSPEKRNE